MAVKRPQKERTRWDAETEGRTVKKVPYFPGYHIDDHGILYGLNGRERRLKPDRYGYVRATMRDARGRSRTKYVHHLVWSAFRKESVIPDGMEIHHIDHNPRNNAPDNLAVLSHRDNIGFSVRAGRRCDIAAIGRRRSRPVVAVDVDDPFCIKKFPSVSTAGAFMKPANPAGAAANICGALKRNNPAYGFRWRYLDEKSA